MIIGIDIDDTFTNSNAVFIQYARKYNLQNSINHNCKDDEWDLEKAFGWKPEQQKDFLTKYLLRVLEEAVPNPNAVDVVNYLQECGHKIIFISARQNDVVNNILDVTKEWMKKNNVLYDLIFVESTDKSEVCKNNNVEFFIDDDFKNCVQVRSRLGIPTLLYKTLYNDKCSHSHIPVVSGWEEIRQYIDGEKKVESLKYGELEYIDAEKRSDFPDEFIGFRYIHFYGGSRNYRAYIADENLSRADFMELYPQYIPKQNIPVYENNGIVLRADPKYPCPGFYILSLTKTYAAFDLIDDVTFMRFAFVLKKTKEGMRKVLDINYAHLLSNEKSDPYVNVHFWLVPVNGITSPDLLDFDVKAYLSSFEPKSEVNHIIEMNEKLRDYFSEIHLAEMDDEISQRFQN